MSEAQTYDTVPSPSRRRFMRGLAAAGGAAAVGTGALGSTPSARADIPWHTLSGVGAAYEASAIGLDYLLGSGYVDEAQNRAANYIHQRYGDMRNYDGYTGGSALHTEVLAGGKEMRISDEQIMTGISNQIEMSDNVGYSKGKVALIEALNNGDDVTTAKEEMNAALNDYYSKIQTAIIDHYVTQIEQLWHMNNRMHQHSEITANSDNSTILIKSDDSGYLWSGADDGASSPTGNDMTMYAIQTGQPHPQDDIADWGEIYSGGYADFELLNGDVYEQVPIFADAMMSSDYHMVIAPYYENWTNGSNADTLMDMGSFSTPVGISFFVTDADTTVSNLGSTTAGSEDNINEIYNNVEYMAAMDSLYTARDRVNADLQGFADDLYAEYQTGDIDLADVVDPITFATELATDTDNDAFRQASAAQLGFSTNATENVTISIHDGEEEPTIETDLYTSYTPSSGSWEVGTQYDPSTWSEPLFITYPDDDDTISMAQLEEPFTIESAVDQDGTEVTSFENRETNVQTADIAALQEEIDKLRQSQLELQQESGTDQPAGGGGSTGGTPFWEKSYYGIPGLGWIGGGLVTLAALASRGD